MNYSIYNFNNEKVFAFITHKADANKNNELSATQKLRNLIGNKYECIIPTQTHSANVKIVHKNSADQDFRDTDALITNISGKVLCIKTADCAPILLYNAKSSVIAAVHAGWKGTAQNIVGETIRIMGDSFNCNPQFTQAYIGPCISQHNYEVGKNVFDAFENLDLNVTPIFLASKNNGKFWCDISEANKQLFLKSGLKEENIITSGECTYDETEKYYSARKEGFNTGRMISGIVLT